ncbi:MAG TPA: low affinity iron permease family protein [Candidatus Saccharimonadales bacterium]|nr:low affinity iron permease family protein [Candidatus Saccharimonadales bacterium]
MKEAFRRISVRVSAWAGSASAFIFALAAVVIWAFLGPANDFSNTWQLVINTGTTIIVFLMVFLIQNTQNRESKSTQLKLDELIRAHRSARESFIDLEDISDEELMQISQEFSRLHDHVQRTPALHKLHQKIAAEHARRSDIKGAAGQVVGTLLHPLGRGDKDHNK